MIQDQQPLLTIINELILNKLNYLIF